MANKGGFIALLIIIAMLTISVAMLAGYILVFRGAVQNNTETLKDADSNEIRRPSDNEIEHKKLFDDSQFFVLKNGNSMSTKTSVIRVGIDMVYFKRVRGIKNCEEKISFFDSEIKELIGTYFQDKTLEQVKDIEFKKKAKEDLKKMINDLLNSNEKIYNEIIYEVVFYDWFYQ
ncbi:MAG: flagellar basal body-associated FliL family protein [Firmicutes bacterium]|nr:flagellar basal body-associated FliL family protein [Bacillota bacterium]